MAKTNEKWTLGELASRIGGKLVGDSDFQISGPVPAGIDAPNGITFANNQAFLDKALSVGIGAVVAPQNSDLNGANGILVENPRASFAKILQLFEPALHLAPGIDQRASIHPTAVVSASASLGANVQIGKNSVVGNNVRIHANSYIGENCNIGSDSEIMPNATIVVNVSTGKNCRIFSGAVIGADGFGYEWDGSNHVRVPQIGGVEIGDNVDIGANTCIDRGAMENTVIGSGTKIDNQCQIGHNVKIGANCILAGMVGIGGSSVLGNQVIAGSAVGIKDHVTIADNVVLGGRTGVSSDIETAGVYFGSPALPIKEGLRVFTLTTKLPEIWQRLRELEAKHRAGDSS